MLQKYFSPLMVILFFIILSLALYSNKREMPYFSTVNTDIEELRETLHTELEQARKENNEVLAAYLQEDIESTYK